jgi:hypothetical protein
MNDVSFTVPGSRFSVRAQVQGTKEHEAEHEPNELEHEPSRENIEG